MLPQKYLLELLLAPDNSYSNPNHPNKILKPTMDEKGFLGIKIFG